MEQRLRAVIADIVAPVLSRLGSFVAGTGLLPHLSGRPLTRIRLHQTEAKANGAAQLRSTFKEFLELSGYLRVAARQRRELV